MHFGKHSGGRHAPYTAPSLQLQVPGTGLEAAAAQRPHPAPRASGCALIWQRSPPSRAALGGLSARPLHPLLGRCPGLGLPRAREGPISGVWLRALVLRLTACLSAWVQTLPLPRDA